MSKLPCVIHGDDVLHGTMEPEKFSLYLKIKNLQLENKPIQKTATIYSYILKPTQKHKIIAPMFFYKLNCNS